MGNLWIPGPGSHFYHRPPKTRGLGRGRSPGKREFEGTPNGCSGTTSKKTPEKEMLLPSLEWNPILFVDVRPC